MKQHMNRPFPVERTAQNRSRSFVSQDTSRRIKRVDKGAGCPTSPPFALHSSLSYCRQRRVLRTPQTRDSTSSSPLLAAGGTEMTSAPPNLRAESRQLLDSTAPGPLPHAGADSQLSGMCAAVLSKHQWLAQLGPESRRGLSEGGQSLLSISAFHGMLANCKNFASGPGITWR